MKAYAMCPHCSRCNEVMVHLEGHAETLPVVVVCSHAALPGGGYEHEGCGGMYVMTARAEITIRTRRVESDA